MLPSKQKYQIDLADWKAFFELDALVLAVVHRHYLTMPAASLITGLKPGGILMDIKSVINPKDLPSAITYWSL